MEPDEPPPTGLWVDAAIVANETNCSALPLASLPAYQPQVDPTYARVELYCAATLIMVCAVSVLNNACVLLSTCWIKRRPLSITMRISLSLTGADTIASFLLGVSWFINNILNTLVPPDLDTYLPIWHETQCVRYAPERLTCVKLALEALRLGAVLVTMLHLLALASNHYLGALRPLHSHVRHAYLVVGLTAIWIVPEAALFAYFSSFEDDGFRAQGNCGYKFLTQYGFHITFSLTFFFVLILMICIYVHIYIIVQRHERNRHRFRRTGSSHQRAELRHLNGRAEAKADARAEGRAHRQVQRTATDPGGPGGWASSGGSLPESVGAEPNGHASHATAAASLMRGSGARSRRGGSPAFRRNKKAIKTTLFILGSYLIGWMPAVVSFMLVCDKDCLIPRDTLDFNSIYTVIVFWSFNMLIVIKTLANSFIYTSRMKDIKDARRSMCNALARRCCRFLPQSADPARGALFGGPPTETTCGPVGGMAGMAALGPAMGRDRASLYSRSSTRRLHVNGLVHNRRMAQSDV
ncbi:5-hydroxytryptamine receptor 1A-like [Thrips palmi]|uniref:5-hydroxytryptamine receptor 1A-like n=1 Tax=Thrips palmi TaxID=161013 RepID=A0A6P9ACT7_THRPL|nr:5-hydroxytryptamine receptor 1A-like [Thrips palmi]